MPKWEEIQAKAKRLIEEGLRLLRSGMSEAEFLAEATADATRLNVEVRRCRFERYKAIHALGTEVLHSAGAGPDAAHVRLTASMKSLISKAHALEEEARRAEEKASKITVVKKLPPEEVKRCKPSQRS
jgi:hypothetical protein